MLGLDIFVRAVTGVITNVGQALRVSGFWWVIMMIGSITIVLTNPIYQMTQEEMMTTGNGVSPGLLGLLTLPFSLLTIIGYLTVAIGWHRHLLLGEKTNGIMVWPSGFNRWGYFWRMLVVGLFAFPAIIIGMMLLMGSGALNDPALAAKMATPTGQLKFMPFVALMLLVTILFSLVLPAIAVGKKIRFRDSLSVTLRNFPQCIILAILVAVLMTLPGLIVGSIFGTPLPFQPVTGTVLAGMILTQIFSWFGFMVSVGYLSEMYRSFFAEEDLAERFR